MTTPGNPPGHAPNAAAAAQEKEDQQQQQQEMKNQILSQVLDQPARARCEVFSIFINQWRRKLVGTLGTSLPL